MEVLELYIELTNMFIREISEEISPEKLREAEEDLIEEAPLLFGSGMFRSRGKIHPEAFYKRMERVKINQEDYPLKTLRYFNKGLIEVYGEVIMPIRAYEKYNDCYRRLKKGCSDREKMWKLLEYLPEDTAMDDRIDRSLKEEMKEKFRERTRQFMESKDRYKLLFDSVGQPVFVLDLDLNLVEMNSASSDLFQQKDYKVMGREIFDLDLFDEEYKTRYKDNINDIIEKERESITESYDVRSGPEGGKRTLMINSTGLTRDEDVLLIINVCRDITREISMKNDLEESLEEKRVLLQEIHHRVKNNMQIILSMMDRQSRYFENDEMEEILQETRNRITSMAMVHTKLYRSENLARVNFGGYCEDLANQIINTYKSGEKDVRLETDIDEAMFGLDTMIPLGIMITELVSNSMKHAFEGRSRAKITLEMNARGSGYELIVADDGIGLPEDPQESKKLGLTLVYDLVEQIEGRLETSYEDGASFRIQFDRKKSDDDE